MSYMYDRVGYVYEGGVHCSECALKRFPRLQSKFGAIDREGNQVGVYFVSDAMDNDCDTSCEDCHEKLFEVAS